MLLLFVVGLAVVGLSLRRGAPSAGDRPRPSSAPGAGASPVGIGPKRVWLIVMENRSYGQVIGESEAPFFNQLATGNGVATDYHGVARPSQPNYLALISGSTQGVSDNHNHDLRATTLLDQLETAGRSWAVFAEDVPAGCFRGETARGGPDGSGTYARKHEPAISFVAISGNPTRCARIRDLGSFDPAAADFNLIVPNLCHSMHDCSTRVGDEWLARFVPRITGSDAFRQGGLLLVTFDEASGRDESQHTLLVFAGRQVAPGTRVSGRVDHYALLRTIQTIFGVACLADSCKATAIPELLGG